METNTNKTIAILLHLCALTQYCIPFGNFIFPIMIWSSKKEKSEYLDAQGKLVINFQLSLFVYSLILCLITLSILLVTILKDSCVDEILNINYFFTHHLNFENNSGMLAIALTSFVVFIALKVIEFFQIILAAIKVSNGEKPTYPLTIKFLK